jgi:protein phosphatase 1 regulatory subunit 37
MSGFIRVCREIFNTCVRNTEEAERANRLAAQLDTHGRDGSDGDAVSGPGTPTSGTSSTHMKTDAEVEASAKAVWGMIDKSQLAKAIRLDDAKKVNFIPYFMRRCY